MRASPAPLATPIPVEQGAGALGDEPADQSRSVPRSAAPAGCVHITALAARITGCQRRSGNRAEGRQVARGAVRAGGHHRRRAAAAGDNNALDHADAALRQALGGEGAVGVVVTSEAPGAELGTDMHALNDKVRSFRQAVQSRNAGEALRMQGQLLNALGVAEKAAADDKTEDGRALRAALADLRKGLDGDAGRLTAAATSLAKLDGTPDQQQQVVSDIPRAASSIAIRGRNASAPPQPRVTALSCCACSKKSSWKPIKRRRRSRRTTSRRRRSRCAAVWARCAPVCWVTCPSWTPRARAWPKPRAIPPPRPQPPAPRALRALRALNPSPMARFAVTTWDSSIVSFQNAYQKSDTGAMLRLQRQLSDKAAQADATLKHAQGASADDVRAAVASIRTAFAGDFSKLDEARLQLHDAAETSHGTVDQGPGHAERSAGGPATDRQRTARRA